MNIPYQSHVIVGVVAFLIGCTLTGHYLNLKHENELAEIREAGNKALQDAKDQAAEAMINQQREQSSIVDEYIKKLNEKDNELKKSRKDLATSNADIANLLTRLRQSTPGSSNTEPASGTLPQDASLARDLSRRLDDIDNRIVERAQFGDRAIAAYKACFDTYKSAEQQVNGADKPATK